MEQIIQLNSQAKLSEHFTLGEFTRSASHPEVYNIPSHEAIENLKRVCVWLEELRKRYNEFIHPAPNPAPHMGGEYTMPSTPLRRPPHSKSPQNRFPSGIEFPPQGDSQEHRLSPFLFPIIAKNWISSKHFGDFL